MIHLKCPENKYHIKYVETEYMYSLLQMTTKKIKLWYKENLYLFL